MKRTLAAALLLALAACSPKSAEAPREAYSAARGMMGGEAATAPAAEAPAMDAVASADKPVAPPSPPGAPQVPGTPPGGVLLAYAYTYGLEVPPASVTNVMKAHQDTCAQAGAAQCQVLGAATNAYGEYDVRAHLELRGEPRWLAQFRAHLETDAQKAGGKITATNVSTEDLTRQIVDTEANLRAQKTLRDRLQNLLASRPGKLGELLEVERELARVQGEIDSVESNLAVMKARVSMSLLTIDYTSAGAPVTDTTFKPIGDAAQGFFRIIAEGIAFMIYFIAAVTPFALVIGGLAWLFLRWRRQRRAALLAATKAEEPSA